MKKKLFLTILFATFLLALFIQPASANNSSIEIDSVSRTIHLSYNKIIFVTDNYIYHNTGSDPVSSLIIQVPYQYSLNLGSFQALGANNELLTAERLPYDGSDFIKWRIYLNMPLKSGDTFAIQSKSSYFNLHSDLSTAQDGSNGHISFNIAKYPSAPYLIRSCDVTITCDPLLTYYDPEQTQYFSSILIADATSIVKNNITILTGRYNMSASTDIRYPSLASVKYPRIQRVLSIDPWGYIYVTETHSIEHIGPDGNFRITTFTFNVPLSAENIYCYDRFGRLAFTLSGENTKNVSINLDENRYTLQKGESMLYWVTYRVPLFDNTERTGDTMKINLDILLGKLPGLVEKFDIVVLLPEGASFNYLTPSADSIKTIDKRTALIFNETDVTPLNSNIIELEIDLSKSYFYVLSRPLLFLIFLSVLCTGYVVSKRVIPSEERLLQRKSVVPTPILLEFCSLFEEKTSLITEVEKLDDDLRKRKIKKRLYRSQRKTAEKKIAELDKDIEELKVSLREAGGRFSQIANQLEILEAERQSAKDGLYNLEQRYLRKKISVVAYQKLRRDLFNRHKKSKTKIDKLIFELREILS